MQSLDIAPYLTHSKVYPTPAGCTTRNG